MASRQCELASDAAAALATAGLSAVGDQLRGVCVASAAAAAGVAKLADATNSMFLFFAGALIFQMQVRVDGCAGGGRGSRGMVQHRGGWAGWGSREVRGRNAGGGGDEGGRS